jgi:DNA-binding transcriptional MerR regulator
MSFDSLALPQALGFIHIPDEHRPWLGNAEELAELANKVQRDTGVDSEINERLVRYYVTMGVLDRPRRTGKEARFSFRHLSQLIILRRMLDQGLSLSNVRQLFTTIPWDQIDASNPGAETASEVEGAGPQPTAAQLLVESFSRDSLPTRARSLSRHGHAPGMSASASQRGPAGSKRLLQLPIGPGCDLMLEEKTARRISPEAMQDFIEAIQAALNSAISDSEQGKKP